MNAYFDKLSLLSYITRSQHPLYADCDRLLKNKFDVKLNFSKKELENNTKEDLIIQQWLTGMTTGRRPEWLKWDNDVLPKTFKAYMHEQFEDKALLSSVYMSSNKKTKLMRSYGGLLYSEIGEEANTLLSLILNKEDYGFNKQFEVAKLKKWDDLSNYILPCTDIILVDQYIFTSKELYDFNIYPLLKEIGRNSKDLKLNIVIFTTPRVHDRRSRTDFVPDWKDISTNIKKQFKVEPNVTFVLSSDLEVHDRLMFTNYVGYHSGDTFNYFDSNWKIITDGFLLDLYSLADREYYEHWMNFIEKLQVIVDGVKKINKDNIIGEKKCNYITLI